METGLEKMRNKICNSDKWVQVSQTENDFGDVTVRYYNETIDVSCDMFYEKDMDQELYITKMEFRDGVN